MQINGIARQLLSPLGGGPSSSGSDEPTRTSIASDGSGELVVRGNQAFHEILSRFDVSKITPREFGELTQQLHEAGEIGDADLRELAKIRLELEQAGIEPDEPVDLVDFLEGKLRNAENRLEAIGVDRPDDRRGALEAKQAASEAERQLKWIRKFALVHAAGAEGVDAGA